MGKLVVLKFGEGDFDRGFPVILQIGEEGSNVSTQDIGNLPPNPEITQFYSRWQSTYYGFHKIKLRLDKPTSQKSSFSILEVNQQADDLSNHLNQWLKSQHFSHLREDLLVKVEPDDGVRFIIETLNIQLRQLPWHLWDLLKHYPKAEIALSTPKYSRIILPKNDNNQVNILAILGNNTNIDIEQDRAVINKLPNAKPHFLVKPDSKDINNQLWEQPWDIFFFAGHSETDGLTGRIYINDTESLTIGELKYSLRKSIAQGLQVAIFNSCDGLGLAQELSNLHIPQIIVMREPVPDEVAQEFLKNFLAAFAGGKSFYLAVREARERLHWLEDKYPCATWLPVICQNPAVVSPTWEDLRGGTGYTETNPFNELAAEVGASKLDINQILEIAKQLGKLPQPTVSSAILMSEPPTLSSWQGRDKEISQVQAWLSDANIKTIGIQGLSGVGKSWLASYIYEQSVNRFTAIFWAEVSQLPDFTVFAQNALIKLAGKSPDDLKDLREPSQLIHELLKALKQRSCLLVVDNLETLLDEKRCFLGAYRDFFRYWNERGTPTSKLLLTTQTLPEIMSGLDSWLNLTGLNAHEGAKLLRDLGIQGEEAQLREFVELVGGHPKILRLAASQLKQYKPNPDIREADKLGLKQIENAITKLKMPYRDKERVLFVSILEEHFNHLTPEWQRFFRNLSIYRLRAFNWEAAGVVLAEGETPADFLDTQAALEELRGRSLLDEVETNSERRFQFHPFVWQYAKQKAGEQPEALREKVIAYYQSMTTDQSTWKTLEDVAPYLELFYQRFEQKLYAEAFNTISICDEFLDLRGYNAIRVELYERMVHLWEPSKKKEKKKLAASFSRLGAAYSYLGKSPKAIEPWQQALKLAREVGDRYSEANAMNGLAYTYRHLRQHQQSLELSQQALAVAREIGDHQCEGNSLILLGNYYRWKHLYHQAIEYYQQALAVLQKIGNRQWEAAALGGMGRTYHYLKEYQQAIEFYHQQMQIARELHYRREEGISLGQIGDVYYAWGQYQQAIEFYHQALDIQQAINDHGTQAIFLKRLGNAYRQKAQACYQQVLEIKREMGDSQGEAEALQKLQEIEQEMGEQ